MDLLGARIISCQLSAGSFHRIMQVMSGPGGARSCSQGREALEVSERMMLKSPKWGDSEWRNDKAWCRPFGAWCII
jgi:hypothetical protein